MDERLQFSADAQRHLYTVTELCARCSSTVVVPGARPPAADGPARGATT